jgi:hypothetical protein
MDFIDALESFNRKERFFLVGWALGNKRFALSQSFRDELGTKLNLVVPEDAFVAMDYHLDWVFASLWGAKPAQAAGPYMNNGEIWATQEDVDLLVAFKDQEVTRLIMIEAKAATGWTNKQLKHKAERLKAIFGDCSGARDGVTPYFLIASPGKPVNLDTEPWPAWMKRNEKAIWLPMFMPAGLQRITRCDEAGRPSVSGTHWAVITAHGGVAPELSATAELA